jgi:hypothetical protein
MFYADKLWMRGVGHVACVEKRNAYKILVERTEGKRPLGRPIYRWVDNNKMDLAEVGWGALDWIGFFRIATNGELL